MIKSLHFVSTLFLALISASAMAAVHETPVSAIVNIHFSENYNGKQVAAVKAHVGLHTKRPTGDVSGSFKEEWQGAQDINLTLNSGKGFSGTALLNAILYSGGPGSAEFYGAKVSYLLTFATGESVWVSNVAVPVTKTICALPFYPAGPAELTSLSAIQEFIQSSASITASSSLIMSNQGMGCASAFLPR